MIGRPSFFVRIEKSQRVIRELLASETAVLAPPSYAIRGKPNEEFDMATLITILLIALFCGAMLLLDRMLCGYVKMMSNSKKTKR